MSTIANLIKSASITAVIFSLSGCITVGGQSLDYKETKELAIDAENIQLLDIDASSGFLVVKGDDKTTTITVIANIEAYDKHFKLSLVKKGNKAYLIADPTIRSSMNWNNASPKIDLTVTIPSHINLTIDDGSGSITISSINGNLDLTDGSGSIEISEIGGNIEIDDGSGSTTINLVKGNVKIDDGSGSLSISNVGGTTYIEDGSGGIQVENASGLVTIDDGSGGIDLKNLKNGLTVIEEGSGHLRMSNVTGPVTLD